MDVKLYLALLKEGKSKEAEDLRQLTIPDKLIKFVALDIGEMGNKDEENEKRFESLKNDEMWFAHKRFLNDPYEFKGLYIDYENMRDKGVSQADVDEYHTLFNMDEYGVSCLSANPYDYLPMWAYYTNNHHGFCVEYDVIKKDAIHEVAYEQDRTDVTDSLIHLRNIVLKSHEVSGKINVNNKEFYIRTLMMNFYMKAQSWSHEKEFRIVQEIDNDKGKNIRVKSFGLQTRKIIAGVNCEPKNIERLNSIAKNLGIGKAHQCKLQDDKYKIVIV